MSYFVVEAPSADGTIREAWGFVVLDSHPRGLYADLFGHVIQTRQSRRHKWTGTQGWCDDRGQVRLGDQRPRHHRAKPHPGETVPGWVLEDLRKQVAASISFSFPEGVEVAN